MTFREIVNPESQKQVANVVNQHADEMNRAGGVFARLAAIETAIFGVPAPLPTPTPPTPTPTPPPTPGALTPFGPIKLVSGSGNIIRNKAIVSDDPIRDAQGNIRGGIGIEGGGATTGNCDVADSSITGKEYGIIISHGTELKVHRTPIRTLGGIDNCYGIRAWMDSGPRTIEVVGWANDRRRMTIDNRPGSKCLLRLSNYASCEVAHCTLIGSGSWLGGGSSVQSQGMPVTDNGYYHDLDWFLIGGDKKHVVELYENTRNHRFERVNFWLLDGGAFDVFSGWTDKPGCVGHSFAQCRVGLCNANLEQVVAPIPFGWQHCNGGQAKNAAGVSIQ